MSSPREILGKYLQNCATLDLDKNLCKGGGLGLPLIIFTFLHNHSSPET